MIEVKRTWIDDGWIGELSFKCPKCAYDIYYDMVNVVDDLRCSICDSKYKLKVEINVTPILVDTKQ